MGNEKIWIRFLILLLLTVFGGCSGMNLSLKSKPVEKDPPGEVISSQIQTPSPTPPSQDTALPPLSSPPRPVTPVVSQPSAPKTTPPTVSSSPAAPLPPARPPETRSAPGVVFNFDNADIYEVIRVMAEIMKINYIIDPRVKGVVNIRTAGQVSTEEVFPIFQSILRLNGATAVKKDNLYEIVPFGDAKKLSISPADRIEPGRSIPEGRFIIQIIPLKYIPVTEVSKILKPFLTDGADIVEHPPHNILILGDMASNIKKALDIIALFDLDIFTDLRVRIYPILNADVTEIAKEMERIFSSFEVSVKSGRGVGITFTPISRINSLLVVSSIPSIFEKVEGWLKELDRTPAEGTKLSVYVYYVQNMKAKDLGEVLKQIYVAPKDKKADFKEKVVEPALPRGVRPAPTPAPKEEATAVPEGEINIVVDETNNALVIRAFHRDYKAILETVKKLDIYPKQVLIEVLMAEITLDDANRFGVEWGRFVDSLAAGKYRQAISTGAIPMTPATTTTPAVPIDASLAFAGAGVWRYSIVEVAGGLSAAIKVAATENRLKIISSPNLLASNNKEAKMQVGKSQPILTSTYAYGSSTTSGTPLSTSTTPTTGLLEGTIEYKDIGIILTITPRISDGGLITLELQIEKSDVAESPPLGNIQNIPVFSKKTAKTVASVLEGQTIVIAGLIEDSKNVIKSGVPLLSKIPILGALFGFQEYIYKKTELVVLLTPHIITDHIQSRSLTEEFKEKVKGLREVLEKKEKEKKE
jgi:general secretion pathway protein D